MSSKIRCKGRFITKKQLKKCQSISALGKANKGRRVVEKEENEIHLPPVDGCRIVDLQHMAKFMFCSACEVSLLIQNIERERVEGLGSHLSVRCEKCSFLNDVTTGPKYIKSGGGKKSAFVVNTKSALGK